MSKDQVKANSAYAYIPLNKAGIPAKEELASVTSLFGFINVPTFNTVDELTAADAAGAFDVPAKAYARVTVEVFEINE